MNIPFHNIPSSLLISFTCTNFDSRHERKVNVFTKDETIPSFTSTDTARKLNCEFFKKKKTSYRATRRTSHKNYFLLRRNMSQLSYNSSIPSGSHSNTYSEEMMWCKWKDHVNEIIYVCGWKGSFNESHVLPALTKTSLEIIVPIEFTATHLYVDQWTSWRKLSPWNGGK